MFQRRRTSRPELVEAPVILSAPDRERIRRIEIRTRHLARAFSDGNYRSVFRGSGIEFSDAREYIPGDDIRLIDWNVTARMGAPWVKEFVEERDLSIVCAVDISDSQLVSHQAVGRLHAAAELAALLGFVTVANRDRFGLLTFSSQIERFVPPQHGQKQVLRIVRDIIHHSTPAPGTRISVACDYLAHALRRRSIVFLISDFFDSDYANSLRLLSLRNDVIAVALTDPIDLELPDIGLVHFVSAEDGLSQMIDSSNPQVRHRYKELAADRVSRRQHNLAIAGVDEVEGRLDSDLVEPIARYFHARSMRQ